MMGEWSGGHDEHLYHLEAALNELNQCDFIKDTRGYLSLDMYEQAMVRDLLNEAIARRRSHLEER